MMEKTKKIIKQDYIKAWLICFFIAFISFIYFIVKSDGFFVLTNDFNDQQIPFTIGLHNALMDGGISGFSWDMDLGTSTLDAFSFYELGSPFFWLSMLFPANSFPYIVGWLFMLKFAFAGMTSCLYIRRFLSDSRLTILGSVLYAFSGFSMANMLFYHFHDPIILFPLLLIGLEEKKKKNNIKLFIFTIFLNCIVNYFFFIGEVVFLVIYYLFRFFTKDVKALLVDALKCVGCGIVGAGMASFVCVPSILFVMGNPRVGSIYGLKSLLFNSIDVYLYILKTLFLPAEPFTYISAVYSSNFASYSFYIPLIGFVYCFAYIIKNRDWLSRIIVFCLVGSFIPLISEMFFLYSAGQMRWWYMLTLMVALATVKYLEQIEIKSLTIGTILQLLIIIITGISIYIFDGVVGKYRFLLIIAIALSGTIISYIYAIRFSKYRKIMLSAVSFLSIVLLTNMIHTYRNSSWMTYYDYRLRYEVAKELSIPDEQYRFNDTMNLISMMAHVAGFTNQSSTDTNSIRDFEALFDFYDPVSAIPKNGIPGLAELLGGKYYLAFEPGEDDTVQEFCTDFGTMYLREREACPIGYAVDSYITTNELMQIGVDERAIALLDSVVLDENQLTDDIKSILVFTRAGKVDFSKSVFKYVDEHTEGAVKNFNKDGHGFRCLTDYAEDMYVYFTVPFDDGWSAYIDGNMTQIIETGGMMMIKVPAGVHKVDFKYYTPGLKMGIVFSLISWGIFVILILLRIYINR